MAGEHRIEAFTAALCLLAASPVSTVNTKEKLSLGEEASQELKTQLLCVPNSDLFFLRSVGVERGQDEAEGRFATPSSLTDGKSQDLHGEAPGDDRATESVMEVVPRRVCGGETKKPTPW